MSLEWFDGADYITVATSAPYERRDAGISIDTVHPRTGINCYTTATANPAVYRKNLSANFAGVVGGFAFQNRNSSFVNNVAIMQFWDNGQEQVVVRQNTLGQLFFTKGNVVTPISTMSPVIPPNQYHYVEAAVTIGAGTGVCQLYIDGVLVINASGVNNQVTANSYANQWGFGCDGAAENSLYFDDLYVLSVTGGAPWNAPLGDSFVVCQMPSASGSFAQFTPNPNTNPNWKNVSEIPPDGITTYNQAAATGSRDSFVYPNFPPAGIPLPNIYQIMGVMEMEYGETDSAGSASVQLIPRQAGTDFTGATAIQLGVGFQYGFSIFQRDVNGNLWLPATLNAPTEFGYERIT